MPQLYILGPMRNLPDLNFPAFDKARDLALSKGWTVHSPADMDRASGIKESTSPSSFRAEEVREFARRDLDILLNVLKAEEGDAVAILPGWTASRGAPAEFFTARWLNLKMLDAISMEPFKTADVENLYILTVNARRTILGET